MLKRIKKMPLERQVFFCFSAASVLLLVITLSLTLSLDLRRQRQSIDAAITAAASYVASLDEISSMLVQGYPDPEATRLLDTLYQSYQEVDIVAVYDRDGLRFYHTSRAQTGETLLSGEEDAILAGAAPYITTGYGTQGSQHMAFHAVEDGQGEIIGFVTVAMFSADISARDMELWLIFLAILGVALLLSLLLSRGILRLLKDSLGGRRPDELLDMYLRQWDVLNAVEEGIIATDLEGRIVFANEQAHRIFSPRGEALQGRPMEELFAQTQCTQVARSGLAIHNRSHVVGDLQLLASEVPIAGENGTQGVLNIFHDKTEMRKLSDELSGAKYMLDTLRFFNHEFMNKLHIILGYLQTGQTQAAIQFIMNSSLVSSQSIRCVADCVRVSRLCALIIGKMMHAAELGILLTVSPDSSCREEDLLLPVEDCVTILGNLLENAIDELSLGTPEIREIKLSLYCQPDCNLLICEDTGRGIAPDILPEIWEKGVSSKGESRGLGLYLVGQLLRRHGGSAQIDTEPGEGTCFTLTFIKQTREDAACTE